MKKVLLAGVSALFLSIGVQAQDTATTPNGKIGKMTVSAFQQANEKGNTAVGAIKPTSTALSASDKALMMQVAKGGLMQLTISQAAVGSVQTPEAKLLAQSEVEEQTGVSAKLKEIAAAKGITLSDSVDAATKAAVDKMSNLSGKALDAYYVTESGVKGHVKLQTTMSKVLATAKDPALRSLASATMPVIKMHLTVSTDVSKTMATTAMK